VEVCGGGITCLIAAAEVCGGASHFFCRFIGFASTVYPAFRKPKSPHPPQKRKPRNLQKNGHFVQFNNSQSLGLTKQPYLPNPETQKKTEHKRKTK
jgi:hypothetical protein